MQNCLITINYMPLSSLSLTSFKREYSTGTTSIVTTSIIIPPTEGIAMGTIMSDPLPIEVRTGINASTVVAVVIRHGLTRLIPADNVAALIS